MSSGQQLFGFVDAQIEQADYRDAYRAACDEFDRLLELSWDSYDLSIERKMAELAREFPQITER